jgi:lysozyme
MRHLAPVCLIPALCACAPDRGQPEADDADALRVCHTTTVEGIDVAEFDGMIDWGMVHGSGREFAIARIADGHHSDPDFAANWTGIKAAGMVRGAYYFFRPTLGAAVQGDIVANAVGMLGDGDLPVAIDVECMCPYTPGGSCAATSAGCASATTAAAVLTDLAGRIASSTGKTPMIYSSVRIWDGASYLNSTLQMPNDADWLAGYLNGCVSIPTGWTDWKFWQYSDGTCTGCIDQNTTVPGVPSSPGVDRDRWNGTLADLMAFAAGSGGILDAGPADAASVEADAGPAPDSGTGDGGAPNDSDAMGSGADAMTIGADATGSDAGSPPDAALMGGADVGGTGPASDASTGSDAGPLPTTDAGSPTDRPTPGRTGGGCGCSTLAPSPPASPASPSLLALVALLLLARPRARARRR